MDGGVEVETGVTGAAVVEVVPKIPATAFFWAAEGVGDDDEQAAKRTAPRPMRVMATRASLLIIVDRPP